MVFFLSKDLLLKIVEHFSFERMVDQYEAVYAGLVKQGQY